MLLSDRKPCRPRQPHSLKKPRPPSTLNRYGAVSEFKKLYPGAILRQGRSQSPPATRRLFSSYKQPSLSEENEDDKMKNLRFPLLGPTREETFLFTKFQKRKGIRCEDFSTEKTVFVPSPLSSPPKTPHHLRLKKVHHLRKTRTNLYNSTVNEKRESEGSISGEHSLKEMGRERTQQLLFPKIKLQKTIVPSKYGYHPRSHSPTHKQLVQCRKKLDALIEEKLHQAAKDRDDNPALSPRTFYELYCGTTKATSAAGVGYTFDKLDCISTEKELPKRGVLLDSSLIQIKFSLPSLEDLLENSEDTIEEETNNEPKETEGGQVKHYHGSSLPQIIIPAPVPVMDETDILSDETDESVSVHDISKWEASLKEKMAKVKSTGDATVVSNREPNQDETKIPIVSSTESINNISKRKKITTKKKKSRTKTNVKKEKKNIEVKENKPLKSDELIYDKSKAKAVTKVAESHGLTAEEANELYLTRDSKLVSQKYLDRLNQMAFGSDESDNEGYDSDTE